MAALKAWQASPAYEAFQKLIEVQAAATADTILDGRPDTDIKRARGRLDGYHDVYTLVERTIKLLEEYYERAAQRERSGRADTEAARRGRHIGNPHFWNE